VKWRPEKYHQDRPPDDSSLISEMGPRYRLKRLLLGALGVGEAVTGVAWTSLIGSTVNTMLMGNLTMFWTTMGIVGAANVLDFIDTQVSSGHSVTVQRRLVNRMTRRLNRSPVRMPWRNPFLRFFPHTEARSFWERNGTHLLPFHIARIATAGFLPFVGMLMPMFPSAAAGSGALAAVALGASTVVPALAVIRVDLIETRPAQQNYEELQQIEHHMVEESEGLDPDVRALRMASGTSHHTEERVDAALARWAKKFLEICRRDSNFSILRRTIMGVSLFAPAAVSMALGVEYSAASVAQIAGYTFAASIAQASAFDLPGVLRTRAEDQQADRSLQEIERAAPLEAEHDFAFRPEEVAVISFRNAGYRHDPTLSLTCDRRTMPVDSAHERRQYEDIRGIAEVNIDLAVNPGSFLALIGPFGFGKTTLARMIRGEIVPNVGRMVYVLRDGQEIDARDCPQSFRLALTSAALQGGTLDTARASAREAVTAGRPDLSETELDWTIAQLFGKPAVGRVRSELERSPQQLSGGQRQRLALLAAALGNGPILTADEPTTGLDPASQQEVYVGLRKIAEATKRMLVVVTHDIEGVAAAGAELLVVGPHPLLHNVSTVTSFCGNEFNDRRLVERAGPPLMDVFDLLGDVDSFVSGDPIERMPVEVQCAMSRMGIVPVERPSALARGGQVTSVVSGPTLENMLREFAAKRTNDASLWDSLVARDVAVILAADRPDNLAYFLESSLWRSGTRNRLFQTVLPRRENFPDPDGLNWYAHGSGPSPDPPSPGVNAFKFTPLWRHPTVDSTRGSPEL
jgi:ABC-type lipoprotein export system ATPase subunit